jgi:hypothetical protein
MSPSKWPWQCCRSPGERPPDKAFAKDAEHEVASYRRDADVEKVFYDENIVRSVPVWFVQNSGFVELVMNELV